MSAHPAAVVLNGREIAQKYLERLKADIDDMRRRRDLPTLATVEVGEESDNQHYSKAIQTIADKLGIVRLALTYPADITQNDLVEEIADLNQDHKISGILLFSPLPPALQLGAVLDAIDAHKDVEGRIRKSMPGTTFEKMVAPPTALAAVTLVLETGVELTGREAVVIGRSDVVGKPAAMMLLMHDATVTICHSRTKNLEAHVKQADIVIAAAGKPEMVKGDWIKPGAVVIDVGDNTVNGRLIGDVEFGAACLRAGHISPVPGGVGPLTNVMLMRNLINLHRERAGL